MEQLRRLPNKEYLIENDTLLLLQLTDILFAYCYDRRTTCFDFTCESHWTISKLSSVFSCFCDFTELLQAPSFDSALTETLVSSLRRSLVYPLYRNYTLSMRVLQDLRELLGAGRVEMVRALLNIKKLFEKAEPKYLLVKLFVDDFAIWLQRIEDPKLAPLLQTLPKLTIDKAQLGLPLAEADALYALSTQSLDDP